MKRVLLIEDNESHANLMATLLNRAGMEVITVDNAESGIQLGLMERFNIILCDIKLPGMSGLEFARKVKGLPKFNGIPLVALSSRAMESNGKEALDAGFKAFLAKPFDPTFAKQVLELM